MRAIRQLTRCSAEGVNELGNLAPPLGRITADDGVLDTVRDMVTQDFFLDAPQCRADGRDLRDDVDAIAVFLDHAGKTSHLAFDAVQTLQTGSFRMLGHA